MRFKSIPLTQGRFAKVDSDDYEWLSQWNWQANSYKDPTKFYAIRTATISYKKRITVLMHREILGLAHKDGCEGDHRNGNSLDNRRRNLRIATSAQNTQNSRRRRDNTSGIKGVDFHRGTDKWQARIQVCGKRKQLGVFTSKGAARIAYQSAVRQLHGEFARLQ